MNKELQRVIKVLFLAKSAAWLLYGIYYAVQTDSSLAFLTSVILIVDAVVFFWLGVMLDRKRWIYYFSIVFLLVNICLQLLDQISILQYFLLSMDILIMFLLILNIKDYGD